MMYTRKVPCTWEALAPSAAPAYGGEGTAFTLLGAKRRHMPRVQLPGPLGRKRTELPQILPFMIYGNGCWGRLSHLHLLSSFFCL